MRTTTEHARSSRILCCVTFHFRGWRLAFLAETLRTLSEFEVTSLDVVIVTNSSSVAEIALLDRLAREIFPRKGAQIRTYDDLANPKDLAWCHKAIIADEFVAINQSRYTHFIYLEDDIGLTYSNYCYFLHFRELLRDFRLLPSFVRMDFSAAMGGFVATDAFWPVYVPVQTHLMLGDFVMVNMPNPYNPFFILDQELGKEYVLSRSFNRDSSHEVSNWGVTERAAMGLCLESVPPSFQSRYVVPVSSKSDAVPAAARVRHFPNNYADDPNSPLAKIRIDTLFVGARKLKGDVWWPERANHRRSVDDHHERYFLATCHDTIIYLDLDAKRLSHNPFGIAPLNLYLEIKGGSRARLIGCDPVSSADLPISITRDTGDVCWSSESAEADLGVQHFSDGSIGIKRNDFYLAADLDGLVRNNRTWCRLFEQFRLIRTDTIDALAVLQKHAWIGHRDRQIVTLAPQPINFGRVSPHESSALAATLAAGEIERRRDILFGPARIRLDARTRQFEFNRENEADPNSPLKVFITDSTGEKHSFSRGFPI
jgi:hypothetical protein